MVAVKVDDLEGCNCVTCKSWGKLWPCYLEYGKREQDYKLGVATRGAMLGKLEEWWY
jgi:hypothetical protein